MILPRAERDLHGRNTSFLMSYSKSPIVMFDFGFATIAQTTRSYLERPSHYSFLRGCIRGHHLPEMLPPRHGVSLSTLSFHFEPLTRTLTSDTHTATLFPLFSSFDSFPPERLVSEKELEDSGT
jgi:hypothetical protein